MEKNKRGQVTIFVVIAIVIVVLGVLIYLLWPRLFSSAAFDVKNPERFLQECIKEDLEQVVSLISSQGGKISPTNYYLYMDEKLNYLCYTNAYYKLCTVQEPFLQESIEDEITQNISTKVDECWSLLIQAYEKKAYDVSEKKGDLRLEILPEKIILRLLDYEISVQKDSIETYNSFNILLDNNLYELLGFTKNIIDWETTIGEADMWAYMMFFKHIKAEKIKQTDDTKVYILTNKETGDKFQFATRSLAFPPGFTG